MIRAANGVNEGEPVDRGHASGKVHTNFGGKFTAPRFELRVREDCDVDIPANSVSYEARLCHAADALKQQFPGKIPKTTTVEILRLAFTRLAFSTQDRPPYIKDGREDIYFVGRASTSFQPPCRFIARRKTSSRHN